MADVVCAEGGHEVDGTVVAQGAVLGGQVSYGPVLDRAEYRRRGAVLKFDQR
jgi:hypothetical protein